MVTISQNDDANGVLEFSTSVLNVTEDHKGRMINVTRSGGSYGQVIIFSKIDQQTRNYLEDRPTMERSWRDH